MDGSRDGVMVATEVASSQREKILAFEESIRHVLHEQQLEGADCPLTHHFAPGAYGREILLPKDSLVVGKIHRHAHLNMLMKGRVSVATEQGVETFSAPRVFVSLPGTKRVVYAHEEAIWVTVHVTTETDLVNIEREIIAPTYAVYDAEHVALCEQLAIALPEQCKKEGAL